jgi:hypothetical protein
LPALNTARIASASGVSVEENGRQRREKNKKREGIQISNQLIVMSYLFIQVGDPIWIARPF